MREVQLCPKNRHTQLYSLSFCAVQRWQCRSSSPKYWWTRNIPWYGKCGCHNSRIDNQQTSQNNTCYIWRYCYSWSYQHLNLCIREQHHPEHLWNSHTPRIQDPYIQSWIFYGTSPDYCGLENLQLQGQFVVVSLKDMVLYLSWWHGLLMQKTLFYLCHRTEYSRAVIGTVTQKIQSPSRG